MSTVSKIVLTGGPCGGKTTALCYLQQKLTEYGFCVFIVPESATLLMNAGITTQNRILELEDFQTAILNMTFQTENLIEAMAQKASPDKKVIIYDRGIMDAMAYMPKDMFEKIIAERKMTITEIRDGRYDAIFHLQTAAIDAPEFYTLENNSVRIETSEEARKVDGKILQSWIGCPHLRVVNNSTNFEHKLKKLLQEVCVVLGVPEPLEVERKFLVKHFDHDKMEHYQIIDIEQAYIISGSSVKEVRVRKRGQNGSFIYFQTTKKYHGYGERIETEHRISADEYIWSLRYKQPGTRIIQKQRTCFLYKGKYFELDVFKNLKKELCILEVELVHIDDNFELPSFIEITKEVTADKSFSNSALANIT